MKPNEATILVVDEDKEIREIIVYELEKNKFKTMQASSGAEAYDIVKKNKIHLVVSDIKMADGDGIKLLQKLRLLDPQSPAFVFVTGYSDLSQKKAQEMGAHWLFEKPYDRDEFVTKISKIVSELDA